MQTETTPDLKDEVDSYIANFTAIMLLSHTCL